MKAWIIQQIREELRDARISYPRGFASPHEAFAVLKEEVDELWDAVCLNQKDPRRQTRIRHEAIQVAAMAVRLLEDVGDYDDHR